MQQFERRDEIKARMIRELAREWGARGMEDIDLQSFDPLIDLLLGACAFGFEQISNEINTSRSRIFERLVEILIPDAMTSAQPAHAVAVASPAEPTQLATAKDLMICKHPEHRQDIFFSPAGDFPLFSGGVTHLAYDRHVIQVNKRLEKDPMLEAVFGKNLPPATLFMGLDLHEDLQSLEGISFFFNWRNEPHLRRYLQLLPVSKWTINGTELPIQTGLGQHTPADADDDIFTALGMEKRMEEAARACYEDHFIQILRCDTDIKSAGSLFPREFESVFSEQELKPFAKKLLWIKVQFPEAMKDSMQGLECLMNCFPVLNRKLHEQSFGLKDKVHILALNAGEDHFLAIEKVAGGQDAYKQVPLRNFDDKDDGLYAIRKGGVRRFDKRDASAMLSYVVDLVKDESAAFYALGYNHLTADLDELDQVLAKIKKGFSAPESLGATAFVFLNPLKGDEQVYLTYWTTQGTLANRVPGRTPLQPYGTINFKPQTSFLVTHTRQGRGPLKAADSIQAFKDAIMTRGRIVTTEDIKAFCFHRIGSGNAHKIEVKKGVKIAPGSHAGLLRVIDVAIYPQTGVPVSRQEWEDMRQDIESMLNRKSSGIHPIRVTLAG